MVRSPVDPIDTMTIDEIRFLFRKTFGVSIVKSTIYLYQKTKGFPQNLGIGKPRLWPRQAVLGWMEQQKGGH